MTTPSVSAAGPAATLEIANGLATLTLDSPATRNAIGGRMRDDIVTVLERLASAQDVRVALIRANGSMFCPGADLGWLQPEVPGADERVDGILNDLNPLLARLRAAPMIIVAAVHGAVAGGGLGLMNLADLVIAADDTRFNTAYTRIGATPDLGAAFWLPRLVGERRAMELLLLADNFDAARAQALGLVNAVVPAADLGREADKLVRRLLAGPPGAFAAVKQMVYAAHDNALPEQLDAERRNLVAATRRQEFNEGVRAFVEKRPARFSNLDGVHMKDLQDKVAIVTGGASGIGRATALAMARAGARVVVADRSEAAGVAVVREIAEAGGDAFFQPLDVRSDEDCAAMVAATLERYGRLDAAFNNAGISGGVGLTQDLSLDEVRAVLEVNVIGVFNCMKHELRVMKAQGAGAIVNTASVAALMGTAGSAHYSASKHAVLGLTRTAAQEYGKSGVRINALCPGYVATPMTEGPTTQFPARTLERAVGITPLRRLGQPGEQAEMVVWLCSDKASFVTGAHFTVDGGVMA